MVGDGILNDVFEDEDLFKMKGGSSHGSLGNKASDENLFKRIESPSATALRINALAESPSKYLHSTLKNKFSLTQLAKTRMNLTNASKEIFSPTKVNIADLKNLQANLDD